MSVRIPSRILGFLTTCLLVAACAPEQNGVATTMWVDASGMKVRTDVQNSWNKETTAVANQVYNGAWEFHKLDAGKSVVVRIHRSDFLVDTYDGASHHDIVFQIPSDTQPGREIPLRPMPGSRPAEKVGEYDRLAPMRDGEITAFKYGNPMMGWMKKCKVAHVRILSIGDSEAVIHLRLVADLEEHWSFDIDRQFTLKVTSAEPPDAKP